MSNPARSCSVPVIRTGEPKESSLSSVGSIPSSSLLTVEQFAAWQQCEVRALRKKLRTLPGVIIEGRKHVRIHVGTYLAARLGEGAAL